MNFKPELAAKVMDGSKTVTRRIANHQNPRAYWWVGGCRYRSGQIVTVNPGRGKHNIGRVTVMSVHLEPLGHLADAEAQREGFADAADFRAGFEAINGSYDPAVLVWRVELQRAPDLMAALERSLTGMVRCPARPLVMCGDERCHGGCQYASIFIDANPPECKCGRGCEMPCWQRVGLTAQSCCKGCPPLPDPEKT